MKLAGITTVTILVLASVLGLRAMRPDQAVTAPTNEKEQSNMANPKIIMLIEAKIQAQRRDEIISAARQYVPLVRAEPGVEAFYLTAREDDPNTLIFYEVYKSKAAQDSHLQQDFVKKFLAMLKSAQVADRVRTRLVDVVE